MKKLFAALLMSISLSAFAGNTAEAVNAAGFNRLSEAEKAEVIKTIAEKASQNTNVSSVIIEDKVEKWVKIGSNIGQGLAGAAREVGVTVNEFATTPVGQMTTILIVWHMVGTQIVHVIGGLLIWLVGISIIWYMIRRGYPDTVTYSTEYKNVFGNFAVLKREKHAIRDDSVAGYLLAFGVVILAGLAVMFTF